MFADQFNLDIDYQLIECGSEIFPQALEIFRSEGGEGCNVTLPLKHDAWQLAQGASDEASKAQAANTLILQPSGWYAHNTDGAGLVADLTLNNGVRLTGQRLLILGAGGATAGIIGNLLAAEPREVTLVNRNPQRAVALAERFRVFGNVSTDPWEYLESLGMKGEGGFDLVINATSLGHQGHAPLLSKSLFAPGALCYDLNYFKASLPLKNHCKDIGQAYVDGLGMLVEQAAKSFYIWTGSQPETRLVIDACKKDAVLRAVHTE